MKYCPKCGSQNNDSSNYCESCGAQLNNTSNPKVYYSDVPKRKKSNVVRGLLFIVMVVALISIAKFVSNMPSKHTSSDANREAYKSTEQEDTVRYASLIPEEIYNDHKVSISTESIEYNATTVSVNFVIENNSKSDYVFSAHSYDMNHIMVGDSQYMSDITVPSGKKGRLTVDVKNADLERLGIENISEIGIVFWAYNGNRKDWDTGLIRFKTDMYDGTEMHLTDTLYEDDSLRLAFYSNENEDFIFLVENKTDYNVTCTIENCSVNGWAYEITDYSYDAYYELINSNTIAPINLHIDNDFLEKNNIDEITEIEFSISLEDGNWNFKDEKYKHKTDKIDLSVKY